MEWQEHVRAVVEMRALAMRLHLTKMAPSLGLSDHRLLLTGGASASAGIRQVFSDIFQRPVVTMSSPEAAAVGAALRAMHATTGQLPTPAGDITEVPCTAAAGEVEAAVQRFSALEAAVCAARGRS
eukprot:6470448-Amphidinium_carterae.1